MNADEVLLIRDIRRIFDRSPIDSSRMEITLMRGYVTLSGTVKSMRSQPLVNVKEAVDDLERRLKRDQRIKGLSIDCRIMQAEKKEHQAFAVEHYDTKEVDEEEQTV